MFVDKSLNNFVRCAHQVQHIKALKEIAYFCESRDKVHFGPHEHMTSPTKVFEHVKIFSGAICQHEGAHM